MASSARATIPTPFGAISIHTEDDFLVGLRMTATALPVQGSEDPFMRYVIGRINQYLVDPASALDIPVALRGTPFQQRVWRAMSAIPSGQTLTYGELAARVGSGPRAVANVCGANHVPLVIPCHRIVAKNGLGGFMRGDAQGLAIKTWLLRHEADARA